MSTACWPASLQCLLAKAISAPTAQRGFAPERGRKLVAAMIEKGLGSPRAECLHIAHLFKASCSASLRLLWGRRVARQGEGAKALGNQELHGSRLG